MSREKLGYACCQAPASACDACCASLPELLCQLYQRSTACLLRAMSGVLLSQFCHSIALPVLLNSAGPLTCICWDLMPNGVGRPE